MVDNSAEWLMPYHTKRGTNWVLTVTRQRRFEEAYMPSFLQKKGLSGYDEERGYGVRLLL